MGCAADECKVEITRAKWKTKKIKKEDGKEIEVPDKPEFGNVTIFDKDHNIVRGMDASSGLRLAAQQAIYDAFDKLSKDVPQTDCGSECSCKYTEPDDKDLKWNDYDLTSAPFGIRPNNDHTAVFKVSKAETIVKGKCKENPKEKR